MQVITPMAPEKLARVCEVGCQLLDELGRLLDEAGLGREQGAAALTVAVAAICGSGIVSIDLFKEGVSRSLDMWESHPHPAGGVEMRFVGPPHLRADYEAAARKAGN